MKYQYAVFTLTNDDTGEQERQLNEFGAAGWKVIHMNELRVMGFTRVYFQRETPNG